MSAPQPDHGLHWRPILDVAAITQDWLDREFDQCDLWGTWPLPQGSGGDGEARLFVMRRSSGPLCRQYLFAERPEEGAWVGLSGYPVLLEGIPNPARIEAVEALAQGVDARIRCSVVPEGEAVTFFHPLLFVGDAVVAPGVEVEVVFAALALSAQRLERVRFTISSGPVWEHFRELRLAEGESSEQAQRPLVCDMSQTVAYLPWDENYPDEAQFLGRVEEVGRFEHFGLAMYRLGMVLQRTEEKDWRVPVFATERVLGGYVPQPGDMVSGTLWLQGAILGVRA